MPRSVCLHWTHRSEATFSHVNHINRVVRKQVCAYNKSSDQNPCSLVRVFVVWAPRLANEEELVPIANLSMGYLHWSEKPDKMFSRDVAHL